MKVSAKTSFFESLKSLARYDAWYNRLWRALTSGIWEFFKNIWKFRRELWVYRWWDYQFTLMMLRRSLIVMEEGMQDGMEVRETRDKKIQKMRRAIQILDNEEMKYIEMAEAELGSLVHNPIEFVPVEDRPDCYELVDNDTPEEKEHNKKVYARAREIEEQEWKELWQIFKGQDYDKFDKKKDWNEQFDGSGMKTWWD